MTPNITLLPSKDTLAEYLRTHKDSDKLSKDEISRISKLFAGVSLVYVHMDYEPLKSAFITPLSDQDESSVLETYEKVISMLQAYTPPGPVLPDSDTLTTYLSNHKGSGTLSKTEVGKALIYRISDIFANKSLQHVHPKYGPFVGAMVRDSFCCAGQLGELYIVYENLISILQKYPFQKHQSQTEEKKS